MGEGMSIRRLMVTKRAPTDLIAVESPPSQVLGPRRPPPICVHSFGRASSCAIDPCAAIRWRKHNPLIPIERCPDAFHDLISWQCGPQTLLGAVKALDGFWRIVTSNLRKRLIYLNKREEQATGRPYVRTLLLRSCRKLGYFSPTRNQLVH